MMRFSEKSYRTGVAIKTYYRLGNSIALLIQSLDSPKKPRGRAIACPYCDGMNGKQGFTRVLIVLRRLLRQRVSLKGVLWEL